MFLNILCNNIVLSESCHVRKTTFLPSMKPCCVVMNVLLEQHITVYKMIFVICCAIAVIVLLSSMLHRCSKNNRYFKRNSDVLHNKINVLLCFAHPDDEVMFFSPTVMSLLGHHKKVFFLCLSTGDYNNC